MSDDNFYSEDNDFPPESSLQPKQGMSTGVKVLLALLGFGGLCMLLCCGGVYYVARGTEFKVTDKKNEILEIQNEITDITIPDSFHTQGGISINVASSRIRMVIYEEQEQQGALVIMSLGIPNDGMVDMDKEFRDGMKRQKQNQRELTITKEEEREFTIDGEKIKFNFAEGNDENGTEFQQITGVFPGKQGAAFLFVQIATESYNEEEIVKMIESIQLPSKNPKAEEKPVDEEKPAIDQKPVSQPE